MIFGLFVSVFSVADLVEHSLHQNSVVTIPSCVYQNTDGILLKHLKLYLEMLLLPILPYFLSFYVLFPFLFSL